MARHVPGPLPGERFPAQYCLKALARSEASRRSGTLVHWLAARPRLPASSVLYTKNPLPLKGVVNLDGPVDMKAFEPVAEQICGAPVISQFLGGTPAENPERYRDSSGSSFLPLDV